MTVITRKIRRAFALTYDLVESLAEDQLLLHLGDLPSNKIGDQLWCIIGARESYFKAIQKGKWSGFSCSLQDNTSKTEVIKCMAASCRNIIEFIEQEKLSEEQLGLLVDLLEHEVQHHGQLIRYIYGNNIQFPQSWNERYTV